MAKLQELYRDEVFKSFTTLHRCYKFIYQFVSKRTNKLIIKSSHYIYPLVTKLTFNEIQHIQLIISVKITFFHIQYVRSFSHSLSCIQVVDVIHSIINQIKMCYCISNTSSIASESHSGKPLEA